MILPYVFIFLVSIVAIAFVYGFMDFEEIEVIFELKNLKNPYYELGLSFNRMETEEFVQEEFVLGLFFVAFIVVFYKRA